MCPNYNRSLEHRMLKAISFPSTFDIPCSTFSIRFRVRLQVETPRPVVRAKKHPSLGFLRACEIPDKKADNGKDQNKKYPQRFLAARCAALNDVDDGPNVGDEYQDTNDCVGHLYLSFLLWADIAVMPGSHNP